MLILQDFLCTPVHLPPTGGAITLKFEAFRTGDEPTLMQARYWIAPEETYVFTPKEGGDPRSVFFPKGSRKTAVTDQPDWSDPKIVSVVPVGAPDPSRTAPLRINLELVGYDANGNPYDPPEVQEDARDVTVNALAMALRLLKEDLDLKNDDLRKAFDVSTSTASRAVTHGSSPKVRAALERMLRGG